MSPGRTLSGTQTSDRSRDVPTDGEVDRGTSVAREDAGVGYGGARATAFVPDLSGFYTYVDYARMELEGRWELIKGRLRRMSVPRDAHQAAVGTLFGALLAAPANSAPGAPLHWA